MKKGNRLRRAALVLALLVLAASVTGVAHPAATTAVPKLLTGKWEGPPHGPQQMVIGPRGKVAIRAGRGYHARFSHVRAIRASRAPDEWAGRLTISGIRSCSGTGTYRWTITNSGSLSGGSTYVLKFTEIDDPCNLRGNLLVPVNMLAPADEFWVRHTSQQP